MLHLQGHMIPQSKGGISKASAFEQIYLQAGEVVLCPSITYHLSGMKRAVCRYPGITPDLAIRGCLSTDKVLPIHCRTKHKLLASFGRQMNSCSGNYIEEILLAWT